MPQGADRPNIVCIYADQMTFRACAPYGNTVVRTPAMDRLARQGTVFENFYANSALCGPCRFATYTGLMPFAHPHWAQPNCLGVADLPYMGHLLGEAGYHTASIGKLHGMPEDFTFGFEHCRQNWGLGAPFEFNHYGRWVDRKLAQRPHGRALREEFDRPHCSGGGGHLADEDYYYVPQELSEETWLVEQTRRFLDDVPQDRPFLLNLGIQHPHHPWETFPAPDERYDEAAVDLPPNAETTSAITAAMREHFAPSAGGRRQRPSPTERACRKRREIRRYYTSVTQVDKAIGAVLDLLEARGLLERTAVILTGDHGEMLGEFGRMGKTVLYEGSTHLPLIVRGPGIPAGQRRRQLGEQIDLIPTLLDLAGADKPDRLPGISLLNAARHETAPTKPTVHAWLEFKGTLHAMARGENLKLCRLTGISRLADIPEILEMYDVTNDPWEMHDLGAEASGEEADMLRADFAEYFWKHAGMMGCSPQTRRGLSKR
ncbi:MAG: sulfatase [Planctomycetota bacterium]